MSSLDDFAADLAKVTNDITRKAVTRTQARAVTQAAKTGGKDAAGRLMEGMSTAELQRLKKQLER
ncbi:hypothetical protein ACWCPS_36120 [Streptomyces mauvecolor]